MGRELIQAFHGRPLNLIAIVEDPDMLELSEHTIALIELNRRRVVILTKNCPGLGSTSILHP